MEIETISKGPRRCKIKSIFKEFVGVPKLSSHEKP